LLLMKEHGIKIIKSANIKITGSFGILISSTQILTLICEDLKRLIESEFL